MHVVVNRKMAWCWFASVSVLVLYLCSRCLSDQQQNTLNVPQVLLPFPPRGTVNANFTLKALRGCFSWSSNRPEVATVDPVYLEEQSEVCDPSSQKSGGKPFCKRCSREAVVTAHSRSADRQMAVVIAEEEVTGLMLRCDVFVDKVHQIEITTTTRELLLGESPEVFDVQAFDEEGNLFSTLDGMIFNWDLISVDSVHAESILRIVTFEQSTYETTPEIYALEAKGLRGCSVIVEPINTGTAIVRAKLQDKAFENVNASSVKLVVRDNIMLRPGHDIYIMVNTTITYTVVRLRQGKATVLPMPSSQFEFTLTNYTVGSLNIKRSSVLGMVLGFTQIVLVDKNMLQIQTSHNPSASIFVVEPAYIGFSIVPDSNWILEVGKEYAVSVQLFDKDGHKIYMSDNIQIHSTFSDLYFDKMWSSGNGSYHHVKTLKRGKTVIKAIYTSIQIEGTNKIFTFEDPISGQQEAEIFDPVLVEPDLLVFPWHPVNNQKSSEGTSLQYQYPLNATGGSGLYLWSSTSVSVATVNTNGVVLTTTNTGHTQVRAADSKNTAHFGIAEVYVLLPGKMEFFPSAVEAEIDTVLSLPLAVATILTDKGSKEYYQVFTDCRGLPLSYILSDPSIFQVIEGKGDYKIQPHSCMSVRLKALRPGFTQLTVTYQYKDILLKAAVTIGAYLPLQVLDPRQTALVTLGSVKNLLLEGGPLPWILDTSSYYEIVEAEENKTVTIGYYQTQDYQVDVGGTSSLHFFNVLCLELGEQMLTVKVGNKPSSKNPYPASSHQTIRYACDVPASLTIVPVINLPVIDGRQLTPENCVSSNKEIHVRNSQDLKLVLNLRDAQGRLFHNFTSLSVKWSTNDKSRAYFTGSRQSVKMMFIKSKDDENAVNAISYKTVRLTNEMGAVTVKAVIDGYNCSVLRTCLIELKTPVKLPLDGHLKLLLVPERVIEPRVASVFYHPSNKVIFRIVGGSGHFAVKGSDVEIGRAVYHGKTDIQVVPRSEGLFTLSVYDFCLDSPNPATANVQISDIFGLEVKVVDKVELGTSVSLRVKVLDVFGVLMLFSSLDLIKLTSHFTPDILLIKRDSNTESRQDTNHDTFFFTLRGVALGTASLTFSAATQSGRSATSEPKDIQVFPSLRLDPRVVALLEGATFQVRATGGPSPQTSTSFVINNETVATVSNVGLVEALHLGSTNLSGIAQATDPQTGQPLIYSRDEIMVHVIQLTGIRIHAATTNVVTGTEVGLYAVGLNDESPVTFANAIPGLRFQWTSTNTDVCKLKSVYAKSGNVVEEEEDFRVSLYCYNSGQTTIHLKLLPAAQWNNHLTPTALLTHEVTFQVFERLKLLFPARGYLLLPNNVNTQIKTNRDSAAKVTYELIAGCNRHAFEASAILSIGRHGQLSTGSLSGTAAVLLTVHEDYGINQTAVVHVEIKPVVSLSLMCESHVRANAKKRHSFPLGINALFRVALHDNIGRRFSSSNIPLKYRLNRFGAVHAVPGPENGTFYIRAMNLGDAIFKVWDASSPHIADYVRIKVDHGLVPAQATLLLGTVASFKTHVTQEGHSGQWSSSSETIVKVDPTSGVSLATATGRATIFYSIPDLYTTQTNVLVEPVSYIQIDTDGLPTMTNLPVVADQGYIIPVNLGTHQPVDKISGRTFNDSILLYERFGDPDQLPIRCFLSFRDEVFGSVSAHAKDLFDAKAGFLRGQTVCYVVPKHVAAEILRRSSVISQPLELTVKMYDKSRTTETSDTVQLPFVPAFTVSEADVQLTATHRKRSVTVTATRRQLDSLMVKSEDRFLVAVEPTGREDEETRVKYEISVVGTNNDSFKDVAIEFKSSITEQKVLVFVTFSGAKGIPPVTGKPVASWRRLFLTLLEETSAWLVGFSIMVALVILLLILCCNQRTTPHPTGPYATLQYTGTPAAAPGYQSGSYLGSPPSGSSSGGGHFTPRGTPGNLSLGTTTRQRSPDLFSVRQ